jgi:hypothetical protein
MGFLDIDLSDVKEPNAVEGGEYLVRIVDITEGIDKNGHPYFQALLDIPQEPYSKLFTHFVALPYEGVEEKRLNEIKWRIKIFFEAFDIDYSQPVNYEEIKGLQAWAILSTSDDPTYGTQNSVKRFVRPA